MTSNQFWNLMVTEIVLDLGGKGVGWWGRNRFSSINLHGSWYRGAELQEFFKYNSKSAAPDFTIWLNTANPSKNKEMRVRY